MASSHLTWLETARARLRLVFADREIFLRSHGHIRFIRISARAQKVAAGASALALIGWGCATAGTLYSAATVSVDRAALAAQQSKIEREARKVNAYKRSVGDIAQDLDRRQDMLDDLVRSQFGGQTLAKGVVAPQGDIDPNLTTAPAKQGGPAHKTSSAAPAIGQLQAMEARQTSFARRLTALVSARADKAASAIRSLGLNPDALVRSTSAQGGPYIPWSRALQEEDEAFTDLAAAMARLNALERGLATIPSGQPTTTPMLTSSFGYRRDPFTGGAAFHAGLDFPGAYGQPILAAAAGRISFVGQQQGYGNCVEVDHGNGIMTRYAHLSGYTVRVGQTVPRGQQIARMGSTGRSTGTHLHFEVRVNGAPINPRRFLEANQDVLQVQQIAKQRIASVRG